MKRVTFTLLALILTASLLLAGCGPTPTPTPLPTATPPAPPPTAVPSAPTKAPVPSTPVPPTPVPPTKPPARDTMTIAIPAEPTTMDAQYPDDGNMRMVTENVVEGLMALDGVTLKPIPALATEIKNTSTNTWNVKLRQGVKFHNGNAFTADDVVFSLDRQNSAALNSQIRGFFQTITTTKKISDFEVDIITTGADPILPFRLTLLKILDKETVTAASADAIKTSVNGTGPYKLASWDRGKTIVIERNDGYWGKKPAVKTATYRFIGEDATRAAALKNKEVDLATNMLPEYVATLPKAAAVEGMEFGMIRMNTIRGIMTNVKLRQAAALAVDKEGIAKALFQGYATVAQGQFFKPGYNGYNANLKAYPFDPAKAKSLLAEAGYKGETVQMVGERGRWLKDGEEVEAVAQMLRDVGFKIDLQIVSFQNWLDILFDRSRCPDLQFTNHSNDIFDADRTYSTFIHSTGSASCYPNTLDAQIAAARAELDAAKRQKAYEDIGTTLYNEYPWIPLVNIKDVYGMQTTVTWQPRVDQRLTVFEMTLQ